MEGKRKASRRLSGSPGTDERPGKRPKLPLPEVNITDGETADTTAQHGLAFLDYIKQATDKRGRIFATKFLDLPDEHELPGYYQAVAMPLALSTIEGKLIRREYPDMAALESDLRRLVSNAKAYNEKTSEIHADAERIRKLVVEYMKKNNPAYMHPSYAPGPTPIPPRSQDVNLPGPPNTRVSPPNGTQSPAPTRVNLTFHNGANQTTHASSGYTAQELLSHTGSFDGKSFQDAQEQIIRELISLRNEEGQEISEPFLNCPSRKLTDYYAVIKKPMSLKGIQKRIRGVHGRGEPTGVSLYTTWAALEEQVSLIWTNARTYNEDDSEISILAGELESFFKKRLQQAKSSVTEPSSGHQKLKLKVGSAKSPAKSPDPPARKINLRMGAAPQKVSITGSNGIPHSMGPAPMPVESNRAASQQAVGHQIQHSQASVNGDLNSGGSPTSGVVGSLGDGIHSAAAPTSRPSFQATYTSSATSLTPPATAVKSEGALQNSLSPGTSGPLNSGAIYDSDRVSMPPPPTIPSRHVTENAPSQAKRDPSNSLISNLSVSTPSLPKNMRSFYLNIPPSDSATKSVTLHLPSTHSHLQLVPTLGAGVSSRPHKLSVTVGSVVLSPLRRSNVGDNVYEARLTTGLNRIEVAVTAGASRGTPRTAGSQEFETEKIMVFVNILKPY